MKKTASIKLLIENSEPYRDAQCNGQYGKFNEDDIIDVSTIQFWRDHRGTKADLLTR